jgi:hypothetical protein
MKVSDDLTTNNKNDQAYYTIILASAVILGVVGRIYYSINPKTQTQNQDKNL